MVNGHQSIETGDAGKGKKNQWKKVVKVVNSELGDHPCRAVIGTLYGAG